MEKRKKSRDSSRTSGNHNPEEETKSEATTVGDRSRKISSNTEPLQDDIDETMEATHYQSEESSEEEYKEGGA